MVVGVVEEGMKFRLAAAEVVEEGMENGGDGKEAEVEEQHIHQ